MARPTSGGDFMKALVIGIIAVLPASASAQDPTWTEPFEPFPIADDLYYVGSVGLAAFLFTTSEGHVLIDAPLEENVPLILDNIRALGFDPADIRIQLASHAHFDHVGGLAAMGEATGAELVISTPDAPFVRHGDDFGFDSDGYPPATPTRTIGHLETVRLGGLELTAHLTPGHTPGCTTWSGTVRIGGDALTFVSACSLSALSMYRLIGPRSTYPDHGADFCRSLAYLSSLSPDIFLSAHGIFFGLEEKAVALRAGDPRAFVDREGLARYVADARAAIERKLAAEGHAGGCATLLR